MVYGGRMRKEEIGREPIEKDEHWDWRGRGERGCDGDQKEWWPSGDEGQAIGEEKESCIVSQPKQTQ